MHPLWSVMKLSIVIPLPPDVAAAAAALVQCLCVSVWVCAISSNMRVE